MGATEALAQLRERHTALLGARQGSLEALEGAVGALDFERALSLCDAMLADLKP